MADVVPRLLTGGYPALMRFGLVGTGPWAELAHGPGLVATPGVELVGLWGRRPEPTEALAGRLGVTPYDDYSALLADVEAVAFAVPPDIQADLALEAARAGKHLLLDKPIATTPAAAHALADAATATGVASVVFFTDRFVDASRNWFAEVSATEGWRGGWMRWFSALQEPDNPFGASPWRQERGALWDTGPHALSTLTAALGPITSLCATGGQRDLVHLVLQHDSGATSSVSLSQFVPPAAVCYDTAVWGESGISEMPQRPSRDAHVPFAQAAGELLEAIRSGKGHSVDVHFGARVVDLLADADAQVSS